MIDRWRCSLGGERFSVHRRTPNAEDAIELRLEHLDPRANAAMLAVAALSQPTLAMLQARIGLRRARATDGLTPTQARVGELVAAGLTNPEIARQLHMSVRTVESHLSRVYREHGVSSRSQLTAALVASGVATAVDPALTPARREPGP